MIGASTGSYVYPRICGSFFFPFFLSFFFFSLAFSPPLSFRFFLVCRSTAAETFPNAPSSWRSILDSSPFSRQVHVAGFGRMGKLFIFVSSLLLVSYFKYIAHHLTTIDSRSYFEREFLFRVREPLSREIQFPSLVWDASPKKWAEES